MPRATSAACEALPPSEVRMPFAAWKPATSSASVNGPDQDDVAAVGGGGDGLLGGEHDGALGRARRGGDAAGDAPRSAPAGSKVGCSSASSAPASIVAIASAGVSRPSATASTAKRTAACAGRLALRVCSMYSRPCSIGELGVLHVLVVALERPQDLHQLGVRRRASTPRARRGRAACARPRRRPRPARRPGSRRSAPARR